MTNQDLEHIMGIPVTTNLPDTKPIETKRAIFPPTDSERAIWQVQCDIKEIGDHLDNLQAQVLAWRNYHSEVSKFLQLPTLPEIIKY